LIRLPEAMKNGVSWPSIVMCAATLALGSALKDIGLTTYLSDSLAPLISGLAPIVMVLIFTLWAAVQTNLSSNLVTANVVSIAALAITASLSNVSVAGIIINIGMMASYSFATPPAMPCVAVASSSGWTSAKAMMTYGFLAMFIGVVVATFIGYPLALLFA
ncbi:MAG: anion permease, partial [Erysipelotrichaceae bacterium]|nr:anion permease [Erysipelotrichaceae bacterium]